MHFLSDNYMQANVDTGCCVSNEVYHRRCICGDISDVAHCQSLCSSDAGCKGYAMLESLRGGISCQLATTSECPVSCSIDRFTDANIGPIDPNAECYIGHWNGGCFIKKGILLQEKIVSKSIASSII
jgi:hypothetical protein